MKGVVWMPAVATASLMLSSVTAFAQPRTSREAIAHIQGTVFLDGLRLEPSASRVPLKENSIVRSEAGRAEILLASAVILRLADNSSFRMEATREGETRVEILTGSAVVLTDDKARDISPFRRALAGRVTVYCENAVTLSNFGVYRFDAQPIMLPNREDYRYCRFRVYKGAATVQLATVSAVVMNGETMNLNLACEDHLQVNEFDVADAGDLDY